MCFYTGGKGRLPWAKSIQSAEQLIGRTPLLELTHIEAAEGLQARVLAKLESFNPGGSVKDRVAKAMLDEAEAAGRLKPGSVIIEPTSGNTGIGLAMMAAARGYRAVIVMPETMSIERRLLLKAYGAELVLTPGSQGMQGAIDKAEELAAQTPGSFVAGQFVTPPTPPRMRLRPAPRFGRTPTARSTSLWPGPAPAAPSPAWGANLKAQNPAVQVVAVEPAGSPVLGGGKAGPHALQGIGAGFVPAVLDTTVYDEVLPVTEADAYAAGRLLGRKEGVLAGISSGAALWAALQVAKRPQNAGKTIVVLLPDTGDRYLSTPLFAE